MLVKMQQVQQASAGENAAKSSKQVLVNHWATWPVSKWPPVGPHGKKRLFSQQKPPIVAKKRSFSCKCCVKAKIKVQSFSYMVGAAPEEALHNKVAWDGSEKLSIP